MAPPRPRLARPSIRLRLETQEDRLMCGEAGLLSAAVVSEVGAMRAAAARPGEQPLSARPAVVSDRVSAVRPRTFETSFARPSVFADDEATEKRDERLDPVRPVALDPIIDLDLGDVADFNLGSTDRSVESSAQVSGSTGAASVDAPTSDSEPAPATMRANSAPRTATEVPESATPVSASVTETSAPSEGGVDPLTFVGPIAEFGAKPGPQPTVQLSKLTARNRNTATMSGGWNPALRGVLVMNDGSRWFAAESGADINHNTSIKYYKQGPMGWSQVGSVMLPAGIQQNMASITNGKMIYSYGVAGGTVVEAWFDTTKPRRNRITGNAITAGGVALAAGTNANYVGAAWHNNTRIVWWSSVGPGGTGGRWAYAYNSGRGWNGPIQSGTSGYTDVGYVRVRFDGPRRMRMIGEAYLGAFPAGQTYLVTATAALGNAVHWVPVHTRYARSALDLWREGDSANHFLYRMSAKKIGYSYGLKSTVKPMTFDAQQARFITDGNRLGLVLAYKDRIEIRLVPREHGSDWIDWAGVAPITINLPEEFRAKGVSAIWPADEWRQPHAPDRLEFAIAGGYPARDHLIYYVTL